MRDLIKRFENIDLDSMSKVTLMNRVDRKFLLNKGELIEVCNKINNEYYLLEVNGRHDLPYSTTYLDTMDNAMYKAHHNGKLNRFKIRYRKYELSDVSFLETKFKTNKGQTIKTRIPSAYNSKGFSKQEADFITDSTPYCCTDLIITLINNFSRLTLVNRNFQERCTIDLNITYKNGHFIKTIDDLVVIEVKTSNKTHHSPMASLLDRSGIKSSGFSKYCMGRVMMDTNLKQNAFKPRVLQLQKGLNR